MKKPPMVICEYHAVRGCKSALPGHNIADCLHATLHIPEIDDPDGCMKEFTCTSMKVKTRCTTDIKNINVDKYYKYHTSKEDIQDKKEKFSEQLKKALERDDSDDSMNPPW